MFQIQVYTASKLAEQSTPVAFFLSDVSKAAPQATCCVIHGDGIWSPFVSAKVDVKWFQPLFSMALYQDFFFSYVSKFG